MADEELVLRVQKLEDAWNFNENISARVVKLESEKKIAIGVIAITLITAGALGFYVSNVSSTLTSVSDSVIDATKTISATKSDFADVSARMTALSVSVDSLDRKAFELSSKVDTVDQVLSNQTGRIRTRANDEIARLESIGDDAVNVIRSERLAAVDDIKQDVSKLVRRILTSETANFVIPAGTIAAFDIPNGCPFGWTDMGSSWRGRTLVAAVSDTNDPYGFRRIGGAETHTLKVEHIPEMEVSIANHSAKAHSFSTNGGNTPIYYIPANDIDAQKIDVSVGSKDPQNIKIMPPYIALYFCKKEG